MTLAESVDVRSVPRWRHRIVLPDGSVTPGTQDTAGQLAVMNLPTDLTGKTVLDIGCSDGFFAFECERRGAARVVGLDNYSSPYIDAPVGFHVAKRLLQSRVELVIGDFWTDLPALGTFDLVLFLGVLYHLKDPFGGMERVTAACRDHVIVETATTRPFAGWKWQLLRRLFPDALPERYMTLRGPEVQKDPSTWWVQSQACVEALLRYCGFCDVRTASIAWDRGMFHGRAPRFGVDVAQYRVAHESETIASALTTVTGSATRDLASLSPSEFGAVKQRVAEIEGERYFRR